MKKILLLLAFFALIFSVSADIFTLELPVTSDTYHHKRYPISAFGKNKELRAGHDSGAMAMYSLLWFHLPALKGKLVKAELKIYKSNQFNGVRHGLKIYDVLAPWKEAAVNWNTRPEIAKKPFYQGTPLVQDKIGFYTVDITPIVIKWYQDHQKNFGIAFHCNSSGWEKQLKFHSREDKNGPKLILHTTEKLDPKSLLEENDGMTDMFSAKKKANIIKGFKRPAFDKSSYKGTVWSEANPWFRPSRESVNRTDTFGGPDFAWHNFHDDGPEMWRQIADRYAQYGITGLQFEIMGNGGFSGIFNDAAEGFKRSGKFKIMPFLTLSERTPESRAAAINKTFDSIKKWLSDPVMFTINGAPVLAVYSAKNMKPDDWKLVITAVEKKHGRFIWLCNAHSMKNVNELREYMKVFDGTTMYGNWGLEGQKKLFEMIAPVMKKEFPGKIFEVATHTNYTVHFHYGGMLPNLTHKFRKSWEIALAAEPDAITATNWFDIYENSRIMPSYELDDINLKILKHYTELWKKKSVKMPESPDLYLATPTNVLLGQDIQVEVVSFPWKGDSVKNLQVKLCNPAGKVLHTFPAKEIPANKLTTFRFSVPSINFYQEKAIIPMISYEWNNRKKVIQNFPQTNLSTSLRPHLLYWCRAVNHLLEMQGYKGWNINGVTPGGTFINPDHKQAIITGSGKATGGNWVRILRNGREIKSLKTLSQWGLNNTYIINLPNPSGSLDWYNLELEDFRKGNRFITPPIFVSSGKRNGLVKLPVWNTANGKNEIRVIDVEAARVPYFHYKCDQPAGRLMLDSSGYDHHGMIGNRKSNGGIIQMTLYRHEHTGYTVNIGAAEHIGTKDYPLYKKDQAGGYIEFDGNSYAVLRGGTAFPYAATFELFIKPQDNGKDQYIMSGANGQIAMIRQKDGTIKVFRSSPVEGEGGSKAAVRKPTILISKTKAPVGKWTHIAAVYDLKKFYLYINGELQDSTESYPSVAQEWIGTVVFGGKCKFPYIPEPSFTGGIKDVRLYGRNLKPEEFLYGKDVHKK